MSKNHCNKKLLADPNKIIDLIYNPLTKDKTGFIIEIDGVAQVMPSGKYIWATIAAAKNALHYAINEKRCGNTSDGIVGNYEISELIDTGRLKFSKLTHANN